jgi:hypothetical protein
MTATYIQQQFMVIPSFKVTFDSTEYVNDKVFGSIEVPMIENGFDQATVVVDNAASKVPSIIYPDCPVTISVKDYTDTNYTKLFDGIVRFPNVDVAQPPQPKKVTAVCWGAGYPLSQMTCREEYGSQSRNPARDALRGILNNSTIGVIPRFVNKYDNTANDSGYAIDADDSRIDNLTGVILYILSPDKPVNKFIDDLMDLHTAISAASSLAGPHWRVDTSSQLRVKRIGASQTNWTNYYGNSQANATLTDDDIISSEFQPMGKEANLIKYYGLWRRPSSGDAYTNPTDNTEAAATWGVNAYTTVTASSTSIVGGKSVLFTPSGGDLQGYYPLSQVAHWDFSVFTELQKPKLCFYARTTGRGTLAFQLRLVGSSGPTNNVLIADLAGAVPADDVWYNIELPIGTYYKQNHTANNWSTEIGTFDWSDVYYIQLEGITSFPISGPATTYIDGLNFGGVPILRVAREKYPSEGGTLGETSNPIKTKIITDNVAKDDSLVASDDSGMMAQMGYAELLRAQKVGATGVVVTPMIKDLLPGQLLYYSGKDWRVTKHTPIISNSYLSRIEVTDDVTNSHARVSYDCLNRLHAAIRPEWQDRQASSFKASDIDIRLIPLEKAY